MSLVGPPSQVESMVISKLTKFKLWHTHFYLAKILHFYFTNSDIPLTLYRWTTPEHSLCSGALVGVLYGHKSASPLCPCCITGLMPDLWLPSQLMLVPNYIAGQQRHVCERLAQGSCSNARQTEVGEGL